MSEEDDKDSEDIEMVEFAIDNVTDGLPSAMNVLSLSSSCLKNSLVRTVEVLSPCVSNVESAANEWSEKSRL